MANNGVYPSLLQASAQIHTPPQTPTKMGPNCLLHSQVGRKAKIVFKAKCWEEREDSQQIVCTVVVRLHTLIVCLE
jgi:hypothetical protein